MRTEAPALLRQNNFIEIALKKTPLSQLQDAFIFKFIRRMPVFPILFS
jgi:hypothetical protein